MDVFTRGVVVAALLVVAFLLISLSAPAEVVVGPPEETDESAETDSKADVQDDEGRVFERIGVIIIRKGLANPDEESAPELVQHFIAEGYHSREKLLEKVKEESPVVVTHLVIDLSRQRVYLMNRREQALAEYKVSTGVIGYLTPPGSYQVVNKAKYAYSERYEADMYNWMGLDHRGDIGMHALKGGGYERRLGRRASHGCIRLSRTDASYLFSIIPLGMRVEIAPKLDEVVFFEPISDEDLLKLVEELLGTMYHPPVLF